MEHKLTFLDGAMGTMLQRHGLKLGEIPELLAITNPDLLTRKGHPAVPDDQGTSVL